MHQQPVPVKYAVGLARDLNRLRHGLMLYEMVYDDERRLIAGFVITLGAEIQDYRDVLGHPLPDGGAERQQLDALRAGFDLALSEYREVRS